MADADKDQKYDRTREAPDDPHVGTDPQDTPDYDKKRKIVAPDPEKVKEAERKRDEKA